MSDQQQESSVVVLGGKPYAVFRQSTLRHDMHVMRLAHAAGLHVLRPSQDEEASAYAFRLYNALVDADMLIRMVAALLVPEGRSPQEWNEAMAAQTADHLGNVMDEEEKLEIHRQALAIVLPFFLKGTGYLRSSGRSSARHRVRPPARQTT